MELFAKTKAVKLRSHLDKYLIADDDQETARQSKNGSLKRSIWLIELVQNKPNVIRLRSCYGKYLTASDIPFLLGMTGKKVLQTVLEKNMDWIVEWEPIRDGFQFKFKSWCGKFLRANGGTPPWRNSLTHDEPHTGSTKNWVLWDVEVVEVPETGSFLEYLSSVSSLSSVSDDVLEVLSDGALGSGPESPMSVVSSPMKRSMFSVLSMHSPRFSAKKTVSKLNGIQSGMDFFHKAKAVRLRSHHDKFLIAEEDEDSVTQDRNGSSENAKWIVEPVPESDNIIRLKSCYGKYLTASNLPFLLGMTGRKVTQSLPTRLDSSVEWEPVREANKVRLKTRYGHFLRANGGLPPWRNSVTHDIPHRTATQDWILWDVHVIEIQVQSPIAISHQQAPPPPTNSQSNSLDFDSSSPSSVSINSGKFSRQESNESYVGSPPKSEGRTIYYHMADETGEVDDDSLQGFAMTFKGNGVDELTQKFREELGIQDLVVCTRSPLNAKLYPLRLQLPPNNADIRVVVVPSSSTVAREFLKQGSS